MNFINDVYINNTDHLNLDFNFSEGMFDKTEESKESISNFIEEQKDISIDSNYVPNIIEKFITTIFCDLKKLNRNYSENIFEDRLFFIAMLSLIGLKTCATEIIFSKLKNTEDIFTLIIGLLKIKEKIGKFEEYSFDMPYDPDEGESDNVFLTIFSNMSPDDALEVIDSIDEEWYLHQRESFRKLFSFDILCK